MTTANAAFTMIPLTMSSREIAKLTGKRHDHVVRDIEKMLKDAGEGLPKFGDTYKNPQNGQEYRCYNLPQDLTYTLVLGYRTDLRLKVVRRWMELEAQQAPAIKAPANMVEALTLALEQQKALEAKDQEIAELAPKAAGLEILAEKDGELGIRDAGRELKVGQNRVRDILFERKWACRQGRDIRPALYGLEHGYVRLVPRLYEDKRTGQEKISDDFRITRKGIARLAEIFGVMEAGRVRVPFAKTKEPAPA